MRFSCAALLRIFYFEVKVMNIYKKMYLSLFNDVTDVIELFKDNEKVREPLIRAQLKTEEIYISYEPADGEEDE